MRRWWLGLAVVAGCYRPATEAACTVACAYHGANLCPGDLTCLDDNMCHPRGGGPCDPAIDAPPGIAADAPAMRGCHGQWSAFHVCLDEEPHAGVALANGIFDTDTDPLCVTYHQSTDPRDDVCLVLGTSITLDGGVTMFARGSRPLVLYATDAIMISGTLDAAAHVGLPRPAGARRCDNVLPGPGGGGAGGSYGSLGGDGGAGWNGIATGSGGLPSPVEVPARVAGGCDGGDGATLDGGGPSGTGGVGGGAVYLIAQTIEIDGIINASGGGGGIRPQVIGGGGGGGSGGLIGLDAAVETDITGFVIAQGGGASSGGAFPSVDGQPGADPAPFTLRQPAAGGPAGAAVSGYGGNGAAPPNGGMTGGAADDASMAGGGGGGGGSGWLLVFGDLTANPANDSPDPHTL